MARLTSLLLVLWVGVTASTVVDLQKRIIGGRDCGRTERLYHVEVRAYSTINGAFGLCGGSLISDRWILTAAHCWDPASIMKAVLGIHPGGPGTLEEITPHFFFDNQTRLHDIMLLQLTNPTTILPVRLPDCSNPLNRGDTVRMAGHASTTMGPNNQRQPGRSDTLQCADTTVVNCGQLTPHRIFQHVFCGQRPGVDVCFGDSGGGVVFNGMIYGVKSFTCDGCRACTRPAGFMDVCRYMDWIERTTGIARPRPGPGPGPGPRPGPGTRPGPGPAPRPRPKSGCLNCFKG